MDQYYRSIISGERAGAIPAILRGLFAVASAAYTVIVGSRNALYDRALLKTVKLPIPVIAVGNITTGGTGKTPTVIMLAKELQKMGRHPAVLTRGYGAPKLPDGTRVEWEHIQRVMADCGGNVSHAAKALGIHRRSLQRKLGRKPNLR